MKTLRRRQVTDSLRQPVSKKREKLSGHRLQHLVREFLRAHDFDDIERGPADVVADHLKLETCDNTSILALGTLAGRSYVDELRNGRRFHSFALLPQFALDFVDASRYVASLEEGTRFESRVRAERWGLTSFCLLLRMPRTRS